MSKRYLLRVSGLVLALVTLTLTGCSKPAITGTVTLNGTALEKGQISFQPAEQGKSPAGAPVVNGKYTVTGLAAGKYKVNVTANNVTPTVGGMEDAPKTPPDPIPPGTKGNDETVEIKGGAQTVDVTLTAPKK